LLLACCPASDKLKRIIICMCKYLKNIQKGFKSLVYWFHCKSRNKADAFSMGFVHLLRKNCT